MGALTPERPVLRLGSEPERRLEFRSGLPASRHRTVRSFRLQPPTVVPTRLWGFLRRAYRTTRQGVGRPLGAVRHLGFAV